jgi:hypothetical protein
MSVQPSEKVQWRNVLIFSVLAYALAWALWAPGVVPRLCGSNGPTSSTAGHSAGKVSLACAPCVPWVATEAHPPLYLAGHSCHAPAWWD